MNTKAKNILKGIIISIAALTGGYFALAIPFELFTNFSSKGLGIFFLIELFVYLIIGGAYLIAKDKQEQRERKQKVRHERRVAQIKEVQENFYNLAA